MSNKVIKKYVYFIEASLISPLCISNGEGELTDQDVICDAAGTPFIPGSSLAGAMRDYIEPESSIEEDMEKCIFGFEKNDENGRMSSIFISDFTFLNQPTITVRDSVALTPKKTAITGAKFDMEVIDTGAKGYFYMEMVVRSEDNEADMKKQLSRIFSGWKKRDIRLGAKKTRGYGEIRLDSVKEKIFDASNILEYANVYQYEKNKEIFAEASILEDIQIDENSGKYITIKLPLILEGGISIRQYSVEKGKPDFSHITANGKPVIPGTSMTGAIRHRIQLILTQLGIEDTQKIINKMFGYVDVENKGQQAHKSLVIVNECILNGSKALTLVRNGISRFEAGTKQSALFKEISFVGGRTVLEIKVANCQESAAMIGFLIIALKDISSGYLAVGGQTAVGRGIFKADGEIRVTGMEYSEQSCLQSAYLALLGKEA